MSWLSNRIDRLSEQHNQKVTQLTEYLESKGFTVTRYRTANHCVLKEGKVTLIVDITYGAEYKTIKVGLGEYDNYIDAELNLLAPDIILEFKAAVDRLIVDVLFS
jgi:hypothetical protein